MIRIADVRLIAASPARRVLLLGSPAGWEEALDAAGIEVVGTNPDLVVATRDEAEAAAATGARTVILLGRNSGALRRVGYSTRTCLVRHGSSGPRLVVPVDAPAAVAAALLARRPGRSLGKRLAIRAGLAATRAGLPLVPVLTLAQRTPDPPAFLAAAAGAAGIELGPDWYLSLGEGDDLQRAVWFCFGRDRAPAWAVKCSRVPGNVSPFAREESAWEKLRSLPDDLRSHVPRLAARFVVDGLAGSIETAASGVALQDELEAGGSSVAVIEAVADWIVAVGRATAKPAAELSSELDRLETDVLPMWAGTTLPAGLVRSLPTVPAVFQHNDLGSWNVIVDRTAFTVLDWESSCQAGLPLWDLVYFLTDTLAARRGQTDPAAKHAAMLALLRGDADQSRLLFERVASAADAFDVPRAAVGPIVTLGWLHHGLSRAARAARGQARGASTGSLGTAGPLEQLAEPWLSDPALGVSWRAFAAARG